MSLLTNAMCRLLMAFSTNWWHYWMVIIGQYWMVLDGEGGLRNTSISKRKPHIEHHQFSAFCELLGIYRTQHRQSEQATLRRINTERNSLFIVPQVYSSDAKPKRACYAITQPALPWVLTLWKKWGQGSLGMRFSLHCNSELGKASLGKRFPCRRGSGLSRSRNQLRRHPCTGSSSQ